MTKSQKIAKIISEVFNGFLTMILSMIIPIIFSNLNLQSKIIYSIIYALIPLVSYFTVKRYFKISDHDITDRRERPPFFITLTALFGIMHVFIQAENIEMLTNTSLALFASTGVLTLITFFWKISGHMTFSTLLFTTIYYVTKSPYSLALFIFTPLIAWARIELNKHTTPQVIAGTIVTLAVSISIYFVF